MEINNNRRGFASDNNSGVHPDILKELASANKGHTIGYGSDPYTEKAGELFREILGKDTEVYFVFTGTAANVLGISGVTRSWNSVIAASTAHLHQDECGAPEKFSGCKVLTVDTHDGKLTVDHIKGFMNGFGFEHHAQPGLVSVSQSTEMGTVYTPGEIREIADYVHGLGLYLHMDGARIANAAVSLGLSLREVSAGAGVDVISFGGTKNGMMMGEAVCFLRPGLSDNFKYIRKQGMQLASKMRFISAQYIAYFRDDLWKRCAGHSNRMAQILSAGLQQTEGIRIVQKVESNGVFVMIPSEVAERVRQKYFFYPWDESKSEYRLMTSWDTTEEDIEDFLEVLRKEIRK